MVFITGDCHGDWHRFNTRRFKQQKYMTHDDYVIICGDFGLWHDCKTERWWFDWLSNKNFTTLFVDGNHENFDRLYSDEFEVVDFHGGKAHKIRENVYHLMRGYVFELNGKKFFAFGGASSHDIKDGILDPDDYKSRKELNADYWFRRYLGQMIRVNHLSWWKEEMPVDEEFAQGWKSLEENDMTVNFVISHCAPQVVASVMSMGSYKQDDATEFLECVAREIQFDRWYFGHYHENRAVLGKFICLYEKIERVV